MPFVVGCCRVALFDFVPSRFRWLDHHSGVGLGLILGLILFVIY